MKNKNAGFTLIEILIAMIVLALGLLGLAALQATSLRNNQSAYNRSQATQLAYDMADRIRANPVDASKLSASAYLATATPALQSSCTTSGSTSCSPALMAQNDRAEWLADIASKLPKGTGTITVVVATQVFTITINWDDNQSGAADANDPNFAMSFQL